MTPQDIATDVSTVQNFGSVNWSTTATYSFCQGASIPDDQRSWD